MSQPLLEGQIETAEMSEIRDLRRRVDSIASELSELQNQVRGVVAMAAFLKKQLAPVFTGKQTEQQSAAPQDGLWQDRIARARATHAKVLQALLDGGGEMTLQQIRTVCKYGGNTSTYLNELAAKNWVQQLGRGIWALK